jgi:hypothetical protein
MNNLLVPSCLAAVVSCLCALPVAAAQFGMVVGVDDYLHFQPFPPPPGELSDLEGAVNDAQLIAKSMRSAGIDLPDRRVLIDDQATVSNFLARWEEMTAQATAGDTIIVSFSGHGGQEKEVSEPFDETSDGLDETIMFHEFDPQNSRIGRLSDDKLHALLSQSPAFNIIWVMDSCHSAGLTRNVKTSHMGLTRSGGVWDIPVDPIETEIQPLVDGGDTDELPNVTQILATASEDRLVTETRFDGKAHGALSWFFAQALDGAADINQDGIVTRSELSGFLQDRVFDHMNQTQQPRILPRGDSTQAFSIGAIAPPPAPQDLSRKLPIRIIGSVPPGLVDNSFVAVQSNAVLTFEQHTFGWDVLNHTGDRITTIQGDADRMIARARALQSIRASKRPAVANVNIQTAQSSTAHRVGEIVGFTFAPPRPDMGFLTLFNIASDGAVQYLHPLRDSQNVDVGAQGFPVRFRVAPPVGADQLVAVFCTRPPLDLQALLRELNSKTAPQDTRLSLALSQGECQTGLTGLFTRED